MSYKLDKPFTQAQKNEFIVKYNRKLGLQTEETPVALFALEKNEIISGGVPVVNPNYEAEQLAKAKKEKHSENLALAYKAEEEGTVLYKDTVFETAPSNVSKLTSQFAMMQAGFIESVCWLSKNDVQIELNLQDIAAIGQLIAEYTGALWNVQYLARKEQIDNATSVEELENIHLDY